MDRISKAARSSNMSKIKSKNTKPELFLRKELFSRGLRYRIHYNINGKPDIVFPTKKTVIFINGCFWHGHDCKEGHLPKTNKEFWQQKITTNRQRDLKNATALREGGWRVLCFWECEIEKNLFEIANSIAAKLNEL